MIGSGGRGVAEAVFLRGFTKDVTLIAPARRNDLEAEDHGGWRNGCRGWTARRRRWRRRDCIVVDTAEGHYTFDSVYPAWARTPSRSSACMVGARLGE